MKNIFLLFLVLLASNCAFSMEKEKTTNHKLFLAEKLPFEIQYIILEFLVKSEIEDCQTYDDFKNLKVLLNTISTSSSQLIRKILNTNILHLSNGQNINTEPSYKLFTYFLIDNDHTMKLKDQRNELFSINRLLKNIVSLSKFITDQNHDNKEKLVMILEYYKKINAINTRLTDAVYRHDISDVIKALRAGANPNLIVLNTDSILLEAIRYRQDSRQLIVVKILIDAGANVNVISDDLRLTPLLAATRNSTTMVKFLLDAGADVNLICNDHSPLLAAIKYGFSTTVELLLKSGANPCFRDSKGWTAYTWAKFHNEDEKAKILKQYRKRLFDQLKDLITSLKHNNAGLVSSQFVQTCCTQ